jgi:hypothetical protein
LCFLQDVQVPVCPLCNQPVPVARGETPDFRVGQHIDRDCKSDPAVAKRKIYANRCSLDGCKKKEVTAILCRFLSFTNPEVGKIRPRGGGEI